MPNDSRPLKILIYDQTCTGSRRFLPGLTHSWIAGGILFSALGTFDLWKGFPSWKEALHYLAHIHLPNPIREIQFWGHGKWGKVFIANTVLDSNAFHPTSPYYNDLITIRNRLESQRSLIWFRTCETFGSEVGLAFAQEATHFFDCRVAGHTYIIGPWQAGLYALSPHQRPFWSPDDGLILGTPTNPEKAKFSTLKDPRRIFCTQMTLPLWAHLP